MSSIIPADRVGEALFPTARREVLRELYGHPERAFYVRELARRTGLGYGHVQRELVRLHGAGLLTRTRRGRQVHFQANPESPVFQELRGLVAKTFGVVGCLRRALAPLSRQIDVAFVYGSVARSREGMGSDVDLMVIGAASLGEVVKAVRSEEERLGRETTPIVYTAQECRARAGTHFLQSVLEGEKLFVVGSERELDRLLA